MYVYGSLVCQLTMEARRGHLIAWDQSYSCELPCLVGAGCQTRFSEKAVFLTVEASLRLRVKLKNNTHTHTCIYVV